MPICAKEDEVIEQKKDRKRVEEEWGIEGRGSLSD